MANVGSNVPRTDGVDKVIGAAKYVDDLTFPDMLFGVTVRSSEAHAALQGVEWSGDIDWSDVVRVTAADIPGKNAIYLMTEDQPALADGVIRHAEEPVALLACASRERARALRAHVRLKTKAKKPLFDTRQARSAKQPIYGKDNVFKHIRITKGDAEAALAQAPHVVEAEYAVGYQEQMYIEPQGVIAIPEADGGVTIYGSLQCPYYVVKALAPLLGVPKERVRVIQCTTGGGFGGKEEYPSMLSAHAALLARKAGRPVKMIYDRAEDIAATTKRHPARIRHRTGFDDDGKLLAMDIEVVMDGGAYLTLSPVVLSRAVIHAAGPYRCEHVRIDGAVVATNTPPNGAFRGFGAPQAAFAIERQIDRVAATLGLDPLVVRQRNFLDVGDTTATGQVLRDSVGSRAVLEATLEKSGYASRRAALAEQPADARVRTGVGLSFFFHGAGFTGNGEAAIAGKLDVETTADGGVTILSGSTDIGQGTRTVFPQIAADALGIELGAVLMADPDTAHVPDSGPTVASRTCMVVGKLVEDACNGLAEALRLGVASQRRLPPEAVRFESGRFVWPGGAVSFQRAAQAYHRAKGPLRVRAEYQDRDQLVWDAEAYRGDAYPCYAWASVVTEVEVDMVTYIPKVTRFVTAQDIGRAIHPVLAAGQIEGGSLQGLGWASMEEVRMRDGRYLNHRMTDCIIPTALDAPELDVTILEHPYANGPHGAKGLGELPMDLPAPAVAAALEQATGVRIEHVPFTPEALCQALAAAAAAPVAATSSAAASTPVNPS